MKKFIVRITRCPFLAAARREARTALKFLEFFFQEGEDNRFRIPSIFPAAASATIFSKKIQVA